MSFARAWHEAREESLRFKVIDIAKGIGIIAVILGHNRFFRENAPSAYGIIYLFHMPLFFILSGLVITRPVDAASLRKRFIGLAKPYAMGVLLTLPLQLMKPEHPSNIHPWLGFFWGTGNSIYNAPIWFLTSLFSALLVLWAVDRLTSSNRQKSLVGLGMFALSMVMLESQFGFDRLPLNEAGRPLGAPWNFDLAPLVASFLIAGQILRPGLTSFKPSRIQLMMGGIFLGVTLIGIFFAMAPKLELNYRQVDHVLATTVCMVAGVGVVLVVALWLAHHGPVRLADYLGLVGKSSLIILILHSTVQGFFLQALDKFSLLNMLTALVVTVFVASALTWFSERIINRYQVLSRLFYVR